MSHSLFDPLTIGDLQLPNRIVMAPLTRCRTGEARVPTALTAEYYAQRASAGLILSEATSVSPQGVGYPGTPGIWSPGQVEGWRGVTRAVHARGGRIFLQLWHVGRMSDPMYLDGDLPVAPSAVKPAGHVSLVRPERGFVTPRALAVPEIRGVVEDFRKGAENARQAGFDGIHIHAANGYLIDEFLQDSTNLRDDEYGGPIPNRARLLMEIVDTLAAVWPVGRIGVHLAPRGDAHDMGDSDPEALFTHVGRELGARGVGFICAREHHREQPLGPAIKEAFGGVFIANEEFDQPSAERALAAGKADAVAFGQLYIANPDLPERFREGAPLNEPDPATYYFTGEGEISRGYTDYPSMEAASSS